MGDCRKKIVDPIIPELPESLMKPKAFDMECLALTNKMGLQDIRRLEKFFSRSTISEKLIDIIIDTSSEDMRWIDEKEAVELGLVN